MMSKTRFITIAWLVLVAAVLGIASAPLPSGAIQDDMAKVDDAKHSHVGRWAWDVFLISSQ